MFRVKLFCLITTLGVLSAACSMMASKPSKAAPDELFYVSKVKNGESLTVVKGFMDKTGKIVVGPFESFEWNGKKYGADNMSVFYLMPFVEGRAGICFYETPREDEKIRCGFIDKTGKLAVEPKYRQISYFSDGLAAVSEDGRKFGYIDPTGKQVIEQKFTTYGAFNDGLAGAREDKTGAKTGFIDKTGKFVIEPKYEFITPFNDGFAVVDNSDQKKIIIDRTGKEIKTVDFSQSESSTYYYRSATYQFYKTSDGEYKTELYATDPAFNDGLTPLSHSKLQDEPAGYVNAKGELEVKLDAKRIGQLRPFSEGFAPVGLEIAEKDQLSSMLGAESVKDVYDWTFIDRKGEFKVPLKDTFANA